MSGEVTSYGAAGSTSLPGGKLSSQPIWLSRPALRGLLSAFLFVVLPAISFGAAAGTGGALVPAVSRSLRHSLGSAAARLHLSEPAQVERFYRAVSFRPAWIGPGGLLGRAATLIDALRHADAEGLRQAHFHVAAIEHRINAHTPAALADLDLLLTDAWCRYALAVDAGSARLRKADRHWHIRRQAPDPAALLQRALAAPSLRTALKKLEPPHVAYRRLRRALAHYRGLAAHGGWPEIPKGPSIKPGMRDPRIPLLRRRLRIEGDLSAAADSGAATLDAGLEAAVKRFQRRNGLDVDGIVGKRTRAALNVPVAARIAQIRVNMERWRWLPRNLGPRYLMVNTAGFDLRVVEAGKTVMSMKAINGRPSRQTPSLRSVVDAVVVNPYWHVPARIARLELLPKEQADPSYFREHGFRVLRGTGADTAEVDPGTVDWAKLSRHNFPYRLRQDPGPQNALGRIKLLFPNRYDVYLHDTPARSLFECAVRTFSHGCVRLEHALKVAAYVLRGTGDWNEARLRAAIAAGTTRKIRVSDPLPIYLVYLTAWADADGTVHFRDDVYRRDRALLRAGL